MKIDVGRWAGMEDTADYESLLRELALRVAVLEEAVAFLELWCEEQQDALDLLGGTYWSDDGRPRRASLRVVDVDDELPGAEEVVELEEYPPGPGVKATVGLEHLEERHGGA